MLNKYRTGGDKINLLDEIMYKNQELNIFKSDKKW